MNRRFELKSKRMVYRAGRYLCQQETPNLVSAVRMVRHCRHVPFNPVQHISWQKGSVVEFGLEVIDFVDGSARAREYVTTGRAVCGGLTHEQSLNRHKNRHDTRSETT